MTWRCAIQPLTSDVFVQTQVRGCNFGYVTTSDGIVMIDRPQKPSDALKLKEEGVVFTSDNIFHKVHTWLQEANPDLWLLALESLRKIDEEIFVPGHGAVCGKDYLDEQGSFILGGGEGVRNSPNERGTKAGLPDTGVSGRN